MQFPKILIHGNEQQEKITQWVWFGAKASICDTVSSSSGTFLQIIKYVLAQINKKYLSFGNNL